MHITCKNLIFLALPFSLPFHSLPPPVSSWLQEIGHELEELFCTCDLFLVNRKVYEATNYFCSHGTNSSMRNPTWFHRNILNDFLNGSCISCGGEWQSRCNLHLRKSLPNCWKLRSCTSGSILTFMHFPSHIYLPKHSNQYPRQGIEANGFFGITPHACL